MTKKDSKRVMCRDGVVYLNQAALVELLDVFPTAFAAWQKAGWIRPRFYYKNSHFYSLSDVMMLFDKLLEHHEERFNLYREDIKRRKQEASDKWPSYQED